MKLQVALDVLVYIYFYIYLCRLYDKEIYVMTVDGNKFITLELDGFGVFRARLIYWTIF